MRRVLMIVHMDDDTDYDDDGHRNDDGAAVGDQLVQRVTHFQMIMKRTKKKM